MMKLKYVAVLLMIFTGSLMCVHSFQCYQCRSDIQPGCEDLDDEEFLLDCKKPSADSTLARSSHDMPYCRKITQALYFGKNYSYATIRECAYIHDFSESCYKNPWKDTKVITCECSTEGCNHVHSFLRKAPFWVVPCALAVTLFPWRCF